MVLGYAGLLPQAAAVVALLILPPEWRFTAFVAGYGYAALIFSFLGGVWWGIPLARGSGSVGDYVVAVMPSLIALALLVFATLGRGWAGLALLLQAIAIALSPLVDSGLAQRHAVAPSWLRLRWHLSIGLAMLTALVALIAMRG